MFADNNTKPNQIDQFYECFQRIHSYRQTLFSDLTKTTCDSPKYKQFVDNFQDALNNAKFHCEQEEWNYEVLDDNRDILDKLLFAEQKLRLCKVLRDVNHAVISLQLAYETLMVVDFKTLELDSLTTNVHSLRLAFKRILFWFNIFLQAKCNSASPFYWHFYRLTNEWQDKLTPLLHGMFVWSFDLVKWPVISLEEQQQNTVSDKNIQLFGNLFRFVLELQTGAIDLNNNCLAELPLFYFDINRDNLMPLKLMAAPIVKRFNFHFLDSTSKLNQLDSPEWYLCQVEQWITRNESFLSTIVDSILSQNLRFQHYHQAKYELITYLLELVIVKLKQDVPLLIDDHLFSHTLDEVALFVKQINFIVPDLLERKPELNPLAVFFTNDINFTRYLCLEKNRLNSLVENICQNRSSWNVIYGDDQTTESEFIICEAADKFASLLQCLLERSQLITTVNSFNQSRISLQDLILQLLDDFRLRLSQLVNVYEERWPFSDRFYGVLNTLHYLTAMLHQWQLHYFEGVVAFSENR